MRRLTAIALCLVVALGAVLPAHALAAQAHGPAAHASEPSPEAAYGHGHEHRAGGQEVFGHCSAIGCFSALPSNSTGVAGPGRDHAGWVGEQPPHLSPALKQDPPVPRCA